MSDSLLSQAEIDALLEHRNPPYKKTGMEEQESAPPYAGEKRDNETLSPAMRLGKKPDGKDTNLDLILDIPLEITVNLGQSEKTISEVLTLNPGAIVELTRSVSEPIDILLNGKLIARGEVVVMDENFAVRVTKVISLRERLQRML